MFGLIGRPWLPKSLDVPEELVNGLGERKPIKVDTEVFQFEATLASFKLQAFSLPGL
jgi:hypothetical protein